MYCGKCGNKFYSTGHSCGIAREVSGIDNFQEKSNDIVLIPKLIYDGFKSKITSLQSQLAAKDERIKELEEALGFYAVGNEWDYGHVANAALKGEK